MGVFFQEGPGLAPAYRADWLVQRILRTYLPETIYREVEPDLIHFGSRVVTDILALGRDCERASPRLENFDPWGRRIDLLHMAPAWHKLLDIAAQEGLVAIGFERDFGPFSRLYQFAKLYLFHPSSAFVTCPLAMSDGVARLLELYGGIDPFLQRQFERLIARDGRTARTAGLWVTERTSGADLAGLATRAEPTEQPNVYRLFGSKCFASGITGDLAVMLAHVDGSDPTLVQPSVFLSEVRDPDGPWRQVEVLRLKDKLGTRALPTADIRLAGTPAVLVGGLGGGATKLATIFAVGRVHQAVCSAAQMRRAVFLARDYACKRVACGRPLRELPLHRRTLADLELRTAACVVLAFHLVGLLGKAENDQASPTEAADLRLLTPVVKLYAAKEAVAVIAEAIECLGGAGYCEDTGLPTLLRDALVLPVWEGTTNVLALEVLRAAGADGFGGVVAGAKARLAQIAVPVLQPAVRRVEAALAQFGAWLDQWAVHARADQESAARAIAFSLARLSAAVLLLELAAGAAGPDDRDRRALAMAEAWCAGRLIEGPDPVQDTLWEAVLGPEAEVGEA